MIQLRPYQTRAVAAVVEKLAACKSGVLLVSPTGSGKTRTIAEVVRLQAEAHRRVLCVAHRRELLQQIHSAIGDMGVGCNLIKPGTTRAAWGLDVVVAGKEVAANAVERGDVGSRDLLIIDEAHRAAGAGYVALVASLREASTDMRVLGVTATPWRLDGKPLGEESLFDDHVIAATPRELIADGYLMLATGFEFRKLDTSSVRLQSGEFKMDEAGREASKAEILGDVVGKWLEHARGLRTLVFACNVTHSQALVERFCAAGVRADHLDGSMGNKERDGKLNALREGRIDVLSNCQIATEGLDIPQLECVVLARPTMSTSLALQMVGRVVRTHPGKAVARIHDHAGVLLMHGLPEQERDWSPEVEARQKRKGEPLAKVCPECGHVVTMSTVLCPHCGWEWKKREQTRAEVLEGVSELDLETRRRLEAEERAANALTESLQAARWRELAEEVRCRGYKPAWALIKFREAFPGAEWPPGYAWKKLKSRLAADPGYLRLRQIRDEKGSGNEQAL